MNLMRLFRSHRASILVFSLVTSLLSAPSSYAWTPALARGWAGEGKYWRDICETKVVVTVTEINEREEVALETEKTLTESGVNPKIALGVGVLSALVVGNIAFAEYLVQQLPSQYAPYATYLMGVSTVLIPTTLGAVYLEPIKAKLRQFAASLGFPVKPGPNGQALTWQWIRGEVRFSSIERASRDVTNAYIKGPHLHAAADYYDGGKYKRAASMIAFIATYGRDRFGEIDPADETIAKYAWTALTDDVEVDFSPEFIKMVTDRIQKLDKEAQKKEVRRYYETLLTSWFKKPVTY